MINGFVRVLDNLLGRGDAAVTVPPLDGALRPNRALDEAAVRLALPGIDSLAQASQDLVASAGRSVYALEGSTWAQRHSYSHDVAALASQGGMLAIALATGEIRIEGGRFGDKILRLADARCITALALAGNLLYVANGSATNAAPDWQLDLLERNASGSIWRVDLESGATTRLIDGLAYPAGIVVDGKCIVYSEAWRHRLAALDMAGNGSPTTIHADLPGYPGRISSGSNGFWLSLFAPRSQLVELVLRERTYRQRMVREIPREFWISPKLRVGRSFREPLQGGGVKHLGILKPWAPTMSAGLCVRLDSTFQPVGSLQSRADGATHGVTCAVEFAGNLFVAAKGDGVAVSVPLQEAEGQA